MTALDFPASPTNGQVYENYVYDSTAGVWKRLVPGGVLNGLDDVTITTPADGQALVYNSGDWVNETPASTISSLTDTTVTSAASGDQLVYNGSGWVNRPEPGDNLIINGAMQVHQRGTSSTGITSLIGYATADRWQTFVVSFGTFTQTIENDAPAGSGFRKSLKMLCTTAQAAPTAAAQLDIRQRIEGQDLQNIKKGTSNAEQLTVSFWVKSNVTGTYVLQLADADNTRQVGAQYTVSGSGTWEKKVLTFPADTVGAFDNDNAGSLVLIWHLGAGSDRTSGTLQTAWAASVAADVAVGQTNLAAATSNYWQVTGVQLEVGPVATPFEFKPFGEELESCKRYFRRIAFLQGTTANTTQIWGSAYFGTTMRTSPSISVSGGLNFQADGLGTNQTQSSGNVASAFPTNEGIQALFGNFSGLTAGRTGIIAVASNNAQVVLADAEL